MIVTMAKEKRIILKHISSLIFFRSFFEFSFQANRAPHGSLP
jgi:hypothetical protein